MNLDDEHDPLDPLISEHLRGRLDPQLGRASAAFEAAGNTPQPTPHKRSPRLFIPIALGVGGLIAAAILVAWPMLGDRSPVRQPVDIAVVPATTKTSPAPDPNYERFVLWRAVDEGAQVVDATTPVRKVRYEALEQIEWEDPVDQATIRLSVPVAQVVLVQQQTF
ncbi:MAG: hypothetical protein QOF78_3526 [Phycisphaerales bacterium]|jgi:hypothetical protein|nr:hypothetical protein [Phycisphaerales bacterium]